MSERFRHRAWRGAVRGRWGRKQRLLVRRSVTVMPELHLYSVQQYLYARVRLSRVRFPLIKGNVSFSSIQSEEKNGCLASRL